jgi:tetratricopeptide (TPR) repeat protein
LSGRHDEVILVAQYVISREPDCAGCILGLGYALRAAGRYAEAGHVLESLLDSYDGDEDTYASYWILGTNWLLASEFEKALAAFDAVDHELGRTLTLYSMGRIEKFESEFAKFRGREKFAEATARVHAWSSDADRAFEWLEIVAEAGREDLAQIVNTEWYEPIKSDPRWQVFLEKYDAFPPPLADLEFKPQYPPELQRAVDALYDDAAAIAD